MEKKLNSSETIINLREFARDHTSEEGWSSHKTFREASTTFVWYRKLKHT